MADFTDPSPGKEGGALDGSGNHSDNQGREPLPYSGYREDEDYSLEGVDPNRKTFTSRQRFFRDVFLMLEGVGAPEKKEILSPEMQRAKHVVLDDRETALIGKYATEHIDDMARHMSSISTFPKDGEPLFLEYNHRARFLDIPQEAISSDYGVPETVGLLAFRDPRSPEIINVFVAWSDSKGGLYHSYGILIVNESILDDNASKLNLPKIFRAGQDVPGIIEASSVMVPDNLKEELFIVNDMTAVNDPRRERALQETRMRALGEYPFFLAAMIYLSDKDADNHDFGLSNPFRKKKFPFSAEGAKRVMGRIRSGYRRFLDLLQE